MNYTIGDLDIDCQDRDKILNHITSIPACLENGTKHNTGIYPQNIPLNLETGYAKEDYTTNPFPKIDLLNLDILSNFLDNGMVDYYLKMVPIWENLTHLNILPKLPHIAKHKDILKAYKPKSIMELAMVLAVIRPGKKHLIGKSFDKMAPDIWTPSKEYYLKKSHAVAYAHLVILVLNYLTDVESH